MQLRPGKAQMHEQNIALTRKQQLPSCSGALTSGRLSLALAFYPSRRELQVRLKISAERHPVLMHKRLSAVEAQNNAIDNGTFDYSNSEARG
jgi:hypothetical protein